MHHQTAKDQTVVAVSKLFVEFENVEFVSSTHKTEQFKRFARMYRTALKSLLPTELELVAFAVGHFELSGFIRNRKTDRFVYWSVPDVRFFTGSWHRNVLVRTAKHMKDFRGGGNNFARLIDVGATALQLTS
jgi:hypothetical protein